MKDLGHTKNVDLDPKKSKENTKIKINPIRGIAEVGAQILIALDHINVNVLKIERKNNLKEAETEEDITPDIIEIEISIWSLT